MFTRRITVFQLFGFAVRVDASWLFLAVLVTWTLAANVFPGRAPDLPEATYWWMGVVGAVGLFASIILHELGHSLVARALGIRIKDITLFIFGGVADMEDEPHTAGAEFLMAVAGPATSVLLAGLLYGIVKTVPAGDGTPLFTVLRYLAWLNGVLAIFNMLPAFPLDGGRVLRAGLWAWRGNVRWATHIASQIGSGFGLALIILGVLSLFGRDVIGGLWWFMIGMFMRTASQMSYKHLLVRRALEGESVSRFMQTDLVTVGPGITIRELVEDYVYRYHYKMYPVVVHDRLMGCVSTREIKEVPREDWPIVTVGELMGECSTANSVRPDEDAMKALSSMNRTGNSRLLVVDGGRLVGLVTLKDLLAFLSLKMDLEGEKP